MTMLKLVLFDMDGVIFEGKNFWLELHQRMGTEKQAWQLWQGLATRDYLRLSELTARKLWQGRSAQIFLEMIEQRRLVTGIESVFNFLNQHGIATAVVSSGPYQLAERAKQLFSITEIFANKLDIDESGCFSGSVEVQVIDNAKHEVGKTLQAKYGATPETTAMIGDSNSDVTLAQLAKLAIAYDTQDIELVKVCSHRLYAGQLAQAVPLLEGDQSS